MSDLAAGGWTVADWVRAPGGSATLRLSKRFTRVSQVAGIVGEISGPDGPLHDFTAGRDESFFSTKYTVTGNVDLKDLKTGVLSDQALVQQLAGQQVDVATIDAQLLTEIRQAFALHVDVQLPGSRTEVSPAAGATARVDASSSVTDDERVVLLAVAGGLVLLAVVVWMVTGRAPAPPAPARPRQSRRRGRGRGRVRSACGSRANLQATWGRRSVSRPRRRHPHRATRRRRVGRS